jgi:glutathione S-transferase
LIAASQRIEERGQAMEAEIIALNTKVDERLKDTRPMWEAVQAQLAELKESDERLRHEQERLRYEMEKGFRLIDRRLERQPLEMDRLHGYQ